jgi:hypothetical protein
MEDALRSFELTPERVNQTAGGVFESDIIDRKCRNKQMENKVKGECKPNFKEQE